MNDQPVDPLRVVRGEQQRSFRAPRQRHQHRALRGGRVHHRERVGGELLLAVRVGLGRAVRASVAATVEREHAAVPREVGDLHLPVTRVDDRPGRQEQDRRLARAVDLVEDPHAVALDVAGLVRVAGPRLLVGGRGASSTVIAFSARASASIQSSSSRCPTSMPREPLEHDPLVERVHERDQRLERQLEPELLADGSEGLAEDGAPLGVHPCERLVQLGPVPGECLQLEPDLLVRQVLVEVGHRRAPLLEKWRLLRVHLRAAARSAAR